MRPSQIVSAAGDFGIPTYRAIEMRMRYLFELTDQWKRYIGERTNVIPELDFPIIQAEIAAIHRYELDPEPGDKITDAMVEEARAYPIDKLIGFDRLGKAVAWCHKDKTPSLMWYKSANRATCFPCGRSFNSIDVLVERDGMSFINAVKELRR